MVQMIALTRSSRKAEWISEARWWREVRWEGERGVRISWTGKPWERKKEVAFARRVGKRGISLFEGERKAMRSPFLRAGGVMGFSCGEVALVMVGCGFFVLEIRVENRWLVLGGNTYLLLIDKAWWLADNMTHEDYLG